MTEFWSGVTLGVVMTLVVVGCVVLLACVWQRRREEREAWRRAMVESKQSHLTRHVAKLNESRVFEEN